MKMSKQREAVLWAFLVVVAVVAAGAVGYRSPGGMEAVQGRVREWMAGFGAWGPLVGIALNVAQVVLAPVPGQVLGLVNGYLYGVWAGTVYSLVGVSLGSALAMWLGRRFGRPLVERLVEPVQLARWDRIAAGRGPVFFLVVFLTPFVPDDLACFLIGMSPLPPGWMFLLATAARLPGQLVSCWMGAYASRLPLWVWPGSLAVAATIGYAVQKRIGRGTVQRPE